MEDVYLHQYVKIALVSLFLVSLIIYCTMMIKPPINRHTLEPDRLADLCFEQANFTWGTYSGSKSKHCIY